jgi:hypothetical protein
VAVPDTEINVLFDDFSEYWHYAKCLTRSQRDVLFDSLPTVQRERIQRSYKRGGWEDLFVRDQINRVIDEVKEKLGHDLVDIRVKVVLNGGCVYVHKDEWDYIMQEFSRFHVKDVDFLFGGISVVKSEGDKDVMVLLRENEQE